MRLITASAGRYPRKAGIWIVGAMVARPAHNRRVLVRFQDDPPTGRAGWNLSDKSTLGDGGAFVIPKNQRKD